MKNQLPLSEMLAGLALVIAVGTVVILMTLVAAEIDLMPAMINPVTY